MPAISLLNGQPCDAVSVFSRGLHYGDGLFETVLVKEGKPVLFDKHWQRLFKGADQLHIPANKNTLLQYCSEMLACINNSATLGLTGVLKIFLFRGSEGRGYGFSRNSEPDYLFVFYPGLSYEKARWQGVSLSLSKYRLPYNPVLAGIKHLNRLDQVMVHSEKVGNSAERLLLGEKGEVLECSMSNIFAVKEEGLFTPVLDKAGVCGVMRQHIIETLAPKRGLAVKEKRMTLQELLSAKEVFICNSVFGIWPVSKLGVAELAQGPITKALQSDIEHLGYLDLYA